MTHEPFHKDARIWDPDRWDQLTSCDLPWVRDLAKALGFVGEPPPRVEVLISQADLLRVGVGIRFSG